MPNGQDNDKFFEWLRKQPGWTEFGPRFDIRGNSIDRVFNEQTEELKAEIRSIYAETIALPKTPAAKPQATPPTINQFTLPSGEIVPVTWFQPEIEGLEDIWFPILPIDAMQKENIISLMESANPSTISQPLWGLIPQESAVAISAYQSTLTNSLQTTGETEPSPQTLSNVLNVALGFTRSEFAKAQVPETIVGGQVGSFQLRKPAIPPNEQALYRREWNKLDPWEKRAILEAHPERIGGPQAIEAAEAGTQPFMPGTPSGEETRLLNRGPVSRTIWELNPALQQSSLESALAFMKKRGLHFEKKEAKLKAEQEKQFRALAETARLAGQRKERIVSI